MNVIAGAWVVAKANSTVHFHPAQFIEDQIAGTPGDAEVLLVAEQVVGIHKCLSDQAGPDNRGGALGNVASGRLVIEMIAPGESVKAVARMLNEPLQTELSSLQVALVAAGFVES